MWGWPTNDTETYRKVATIRGDSMQHLPDAVTKILIDMENNNAPLISQKERMEDILQVDVTEDEQETLDFDLDETWMDTLLEGICGEEEKVSEKVSEDSSDDKEGQPLEAEMTEEDETVDHDPTEDVQREETGSATDISDVVETITISLITTRRITPTGISVRRSHQISTSRFIQPHLMAGRTSLPTYRVN